MVHVANISHIVQRLTDKTGKVHEIEPGEHDDIDIEKDNPHVEAKVTARLIAVGGTEKQAAEASEAGVVIEPKPAPAGRSKPAGEKHSE